ncbi:MAG: polysaccharide deacetylase family protein [Bacteroidia bacterium]
MQAPVLHIYTDKIGPRLRYTMDLVFRTLLGFHYRLITDSKQVNLIQGPLLVYCADPMQFETGLRIRAVDLLFEKGLYEQNLRPAYLDELPVIFRTHQRYDIPFDPFAAIFYLVSRYEEYLPHITDNHDRFKPDGNLFVEQQWLQKPLADHYAILLAVHLRKRWPELPMPDRRYSFLPTIDVDQLFAYKHKGVFRTAYGMMQDVKNRNWEQLSERIDVLKERRTDPFDNFDFLHHQHKKSGGNPVFFFLMGDYGGYDNAHSPYREAYRERIKSTADHYRVGLHPSYRSNIQPQLIDRERRLLEDILNRPVTLSRQHFLKLRLPGTYRELIKRDFEADFSMAYAKHPGFRSGTATPHFYYDLDQEAPTALMIYPTCVMDTGLQQYMQLKPEQAKVLISQLIEEVKAVEGCFISLWHNSSVGEHGPWIGWREVYEHLIAEASQS